MTSGTGAVRRGGSPPLFLSLAAASRPFGSNQFAVCPSQPCWGEEELV